MNTGTLVRQRGSDCMDIRFGLYDYHGGLQCGETLDVTVMIGVLWCRVLWQRFFAWPAQLCSLIGVFEGST